MRIIRHAARHSILIMQQAPRTAVAPGACFVALWSFVGRIQTQAGRFRLPAFMIHGIAAESAAGADHDISGGWRRQTTDFSVPQPLYGRHTGHPARPQTLSAKSWRCLPPCSKDAGRRVRLHPQTAAAHLHLKRESPAEESCLHGEFTPAPGLSGARCRRLPCPVWSEWISAYPKYSIRFRHHFSGPC